MTDKDRSFASVFYDADCQFCVNAARRCERVLARRRFELVPLQTPGSSASFGVPDDQLLAEMRLRLRDGTVFGGVAAVAEIARRIWWAWPLWALSRLPGAMRPMRATYRWIARHRSCANGACEMDARGSLWPIGLLPLLILPVIALLLVSWMPRWGFMWAMACALYAGCKWLTYREARARNVAPDRLRALGYLLAWPGMDATAFLCGTDRLPQPRPSEWMVAALKTSLGATLIWVGARTALPVHPLLAGWLGMVGLIFVFRLSRDQHRLRVFAHHLFAGCHPAALATALSYRLGSHHAQRRPATIRRPRPRSLGDSSRARSRQGAGRRASRYGGQPSLRISTGLAMSDVGMIQGCKSVGFPFETREPLRVGRKPSVERMPLRFR